MNLIEVPVAWRSDGSVLHSIPRYCFAGPLVAETVHAQSFDQQHDFRALVTTYQGDHGPADNVDFYCTRCLLQLSGPQANHYHRAIYATEEAAVQE